MQTYPLLQTQMGVFAECLRYPESTQYNIPFISELPREIDPQRAAQAIESVVRNRKELRLRFMLNEDGEPVQYVGSADDFQVIRRHMTQEAFEAYKHDFCRPFNLLDDTILIRAELAETEEKNYLLIDIHHAIADGLSLGHRFCKLDLTDAYAGRQLEPIAFGVLEQAVEEQTSFGSKQYQRDRKYYLDKFQGVALATLSAGSADPIGKLLKTSACIDADEIDTWCGQHQLPADAVFQAAVSYVLSVFTREDTVAFEITSSARFDKRLRDSFGMFVQTIPVLAQIQPDESAENFVRACMGEKLSALRHHRYPFTHFCRELQVKPGVQFNYLAIGEDLESLDFGPELPKAPLYQQEPETAFSDLSVSIYRRGAQYEIRAASSEKMNTMAVLSAFADAVCAVVHAILAASDRPMRDISVLSEKAAEEILAFSRGEELLFDTTETIVSIYRNRAKETPDAPCVVFDGHTLSYAQVDSLSDKIALHLIRNCGVCPGDIIGVGIDRSEWMLIYPLAVQKTGAAYMPMDRHLPAARLVFMAQDAGLKLILTDDPSGFPEGAAFDCAMLDKEFCLSLPECGADAAAVLAETAPKADDLLVVLYTSGSTGTPKAVLLEHKGIVNYCHWYVHEFHMVPADHAAAYANFAFDAHMIDLYPTALAGGTVYIVPDEIRLDAIELNRFLEQNGVTVQFLTTQIGVMIRELNHGLRVLNVGGEKLPPITEPEYRLNNVYGPTECSLYSTFYYIHGQTDGSLIGRPLANYRLYIIDTACHALPKGVAGELLIAGAGVGRGYMGRPELTAEKFITFTEPLTGERVRAYRSGDLCSWDEDGNIRYIGRLDGQVKLRGLRIELGEVENCAAAFEGILQAVAVVVDGRLVLYYTSGDGQKLDEGALRASLSDRLADYMVPAVYVHMDAMPMTPSGKVNRRALPKPQAEINEIVPPATAREGQVLDLVYAQLSRKDFGVTDDLVGVGLSSVAMMRLTASIYKLTGRKIAVSAVMKHPTVRAIADLLSEADQAASVPFHRFDKQEYYPMAANQQGLFLDWEKNKNTTQYNVPVVSEFEHTDAECLADAVRRVLDAHSYLKARFEQNDNGIMLRRCDDESAVVSVEHPDSRPDQAYFQAKVQPFNLLGDRLYHIAVVSYGTKTWLFADIHHILYDGLTAAMFLREVKAVCEGAEPTPEDATAFDYALYEQEYNASPAFEADETYFGTLLAEAETAVFPESAEPEGKNICVEKLSFTAGDIAGFCREQKITAADLFQAAFAETLHRCCSAAVPMYLTVSSGRTADSSLMNCAGMLVRTLPVVYPGGVQDSVQDLLAGMHCQMQDTVQHEMYPYTGLVERFGLSAQIMFVYQGDVMQDGELGGKYSLALDTVKFPLSIMLYPQGNEFAAEAEYDGTRYAASDIRALLCGFRQVVCGLTVKQSLKEVRLLSAEEESAVAALSRGETLPYDHECTWVDLFLQSAREHPDNIAVADCDGSLTYAELDRLSNAAAARLRADGVRDGDFVAVKMGRVKEFPAAVLGIMRAGAAYVPIDPEYPAERIDYMLADSGSCFVLTQDWVLQAAESHADARPVNYAVPTGRAYMIYTSGSTGKPKGVVQSHRSLCAFAVWRVHALHITAEGRYAHITSFSFDASLDDMVSPLAAGAQVHIISDDMRRNMGELCDYLVRCGIVGMTAPTQMGMELLSEHPDLKLDYLMMGGEKLKPIAGTSVQIINGYGPTEFTVCATMYRVGGTEQNIPIGRPVPNVAVYICDGQGNLLPQGIAGEICLAGPQIAEGYWQLPEMTAEKFAPISVCGQPVSAYHTGDIARYDTDGNLEYMGRADGQIKLRGYRIELGEIETLAQTYPGILQAVADVRQDHLILYYTVLDAQSAVGVDLLRAYMAQSLAEYMVPSVFMGLDTMPLTPNGKVNKKALPQPKFTRMTDYVAPSTEAERITADCIAQVLGLTESVGALDSFFALGGDSIKAIRLVSRLRENGLSVQVSEIMSGKTVKAIAEAARNNSNRAQINQNPIEGAVTDTPIIRFFKALKLPVPSHFNQATLRRCAKRVDADALQRALDAVVYQHDMLRAVVSENGLTVQPAETTVSVEEYTAAGAAEITDVCAAIQSGMQPEKALFRAALLHGAQEDYLFLCAHHLIVDGVSWRVLLSDLEAGYTAAVNGGTITLPAKTSTYRDYADAVTAYAHTTAFLQQKPYWTRVEEKLSSLPASAYTDYNRHIGSLSAVMDEEATQKFLSCHRESCNLTVNDVLMTAVVRAYGRVMKAQAVSVQLEGHGRENIDAKLVTDRTVGWFTSAYPVVLEHISAQAEDIKADLLVVKDTLHRVPENGVGYNILRYMPGEDGTEPSAESGTMMSLNYLGQMDDAESDASFFRTENAIDIGLSVAKGNLFGTDLDVNCLVSGGCFRMAVSYDADKIGASNAQAFADAVQEELVTVSDFLAQNSDALTVPADLGETEWSVEEFSDTVRSFADRGEHISRIYPLLPMQEAMLFKHLSEPESWAYRLVSIFEMDFQPDEAALRAAMNRLADKYEVLRTAIVYQDVAAARQVITDRVLPVRMYDFTDSDDPRQAVTQLRRDILTNDFELQEKPLFALYCAKKPDGGAYLLTAVHHIIVDGWSQQNYMSDLMDFICRETESEAVESVVSKDGVYENHIREVLSRDREQALNYWQTLLSDYENKAGVPSYGTVPAEEQSEIDILEQPLGVGRSAAFRWLCESAGTTLSSGMETVWGLVLCTLNNSTDAVFARVVSGRDKSEYDLNELTGLFINSVPVRVRTNEDTTALGLLASMQQQSNESGRYDYCPMADIMARSGQDNSLAEVVFAFENFVANSGETALAGNASFRPVLVREEPIGNVSVSGFVNAEDELCLRINFNRELYRLADMRRLVQLFSVLMDGMAAQPEVPIASLPRLSAEQLPGILELSAGEILNYDMTRTWVSLVMEAAAKYPDDLAVADGTTSMTYRQLEEAVNAVAAGLIAAGVQPNDFVGVKMHRVKEYLAAILGINLAGAAFVPMDPEYPNDRIAFMLHDCGADVLLTEDSVNRMMQDNAGKRVADRSVPAGNAYIIYTSGSTGKPKGVVLHQAGLLNMIQADIQLVKLTRSDRIFCHSSFCFDASLDYMCPILTLGGSSHIMPDEIRRDPEAMYNFITEHNVTGGGFTTSLAEVMLKMYPDMPLRYLKGGGEKMNSCSNDRIEIFNMYGPSECTVNSTAYRIAPGTCPETVPIGRPLSNAWGFVVDAHGNLLPRGVAGELCYAGVQVGYGYKNRPELTEKNFVDCPFVPTDAQGRKLRMYHTGDLVRYNEEGQLEYLGRIDQQIKLSGYRIELGEIENCAQQYPGIVQAVAAVRHNQLVLYYAAQTEDAVDTAKLKAVMTQSLAKYMVPGVFMYMQTMPVTPGGKIDRKALPEPEIQNTMFIMPPENTMEETALRIAREMLGRTDFGVKHNLFEMGMGSIMAIKYVARLQTALHKKLKVADLMQLNNIRDFLDKKRRMMWWAAPFDPDKPILVLAMGVVLLVGLKHIIDALSQNFNVLVIEACQLHYPMFMEGDSYEEVFAFYDAMLEFMIPEGHDIFGFFGTSFGGEMSVKLAELYAKRTGKYPYAFVGDTSFDPPMSQEDLELFTNDPKKFVELHDPIHIAGIYDLEGMFGTLIKLRQSQQKLPFYSGPVVYMNALRDVNTGMTIEPEVLEQKLSTVRAVASNLQIIDFPDYNHTSLHEPPSLVPAEVINSYLLKK